MRVYICMYVCRLDQEASPELSREKESGLSGEEMVMNVRDVKDRMLNIDL